MSRYAVLDDESSCDDESTSHKADVLALLQNQNASVALMTIPPQSGGSYVIRSDPMTGVNWSNTDTPVDTGFSAADIEACVRVVSGLGNCCILLRTFLTFSDRDKFELIQATSIETIACCTASIS